MAMLPEVAADLSQETSELNSVLLNPIKNRIKASTQRWSQRHPKWRESEQIHRAFRIPDDDDKEVRSKSKTEGVQKIVVPYSYAQLQSMLAFLVGVFTDRKPLIPVEPVGDYMKAAIVHEHMLEYQMDNMLPRGLLVWIQVFLDALRYDCGIIKNTWTIREWPDILRMVFPDGEGGVIDEVIEDDVVAYEGNEMVNVSPFDFYPDPNVSMGEFQRGEFVAHRMKISPSALATKEAEGLYVGTKFVPRRGSGYAESSMLFSGGRSSLPETVGMAQQSLTNFTDEYDDGFVTLQEMWWFCHPEDLGLPTSRRDSRVPTLWVFTLANDSRIIRAEAANLPGRRFPFGLVQCNYDIHSPATPSTVESTAGLQYILNFLLNSRVAAVRKTLNNEVIIDPSVIEAVDWEQPNPSGIWRVTKDYYGAGAAKDAVFPLPVQDVTQNHLGRDAPFMMGLMDRITGAGDTLQGLPASGRRSATEMGSVIQMSHGRMKLIAAIFGVGLADICNMQIANTRTFFGQRLQLPVNQVYRDILGANFIDITPELLQGTFRVPFLESGIPTDKTFHANVLREILTLWMQSGGGAPGTPSAAINGVEILIALLRTLGIKNVKDYILPQAILQAQQMTAQVQVMPDQQVMDQVQQGNLIPANTQQVQSRDGAPVGPNTGDNGAMAAGGMG